MNVKNNVKKVFAVAAGFALVGVTLAGAMAYDLSNYPAPFVEDGMASGTIVVGANAATADVLGAIDIAASLQAEAVTGTPVSGGEITVEGGEQIDNVPLNSVIAGDYTESDVSGLIDGTVRWDGSTYDVYEQLTLGDLYVDTYYPGGTADDDFGSDPYMVVDTAGTIKYIYYFDEAIDGAGGDSTFADKPLEIRFLGKTLSISDIDTGVMTVESSSDYYMEEGDSVEVGGHDVTLKRIGADAVLVTVDGQTLAVENDGESVEFDQADYFQVEVSSLFYIENADDNSATLTLGETLTDEVEDDEPMELYGESSEDDEAEWFWEISVTGANDIQEGDYIAAYQGMVRTQKDATAADERPALAMGESLDFPNNYASIEFAGFESSAMTDYNDLDVDTSNVKLDGTYVDTIEISSDTGKDSFYVYDSGSYVDKSSKIYIAPGADADHVDIYDVDKEIIVDEAVVAEDTVVLELDEATYTFTMTDGAWEIEDDTGDVFTLAIDNTDFAMIGTSTEADADDVLFGTTDISEDDETYRTTQGTIFDDMESMLVEDSFSISVPNEAQLPVVIVKSSGAVVSSTSDGMSYMVNPIDVGFAVLDTDAGAFGTTPMIIVGGPAANTVAAEFLGNPTQEELMATFSEGKALIMYDDDKMAMLVAGWDKLETQGASYVVADYKNPKWADKFVGTELEVVVTDLQNLVVNTVE